MRAMQAKASVPVTVYWRPGCPYCARLRQDLRALGLRTREVNIWTDPAAAAVVRGHAGGNETVPTVVIGEHGYVNPPAATVLEAVRLAVPGFTPDEGLARSGRRIRMLRAVQWAVIAALVAASFAADGTGRSALSWTLDGVAVAVYGAFRLTTTRMARR
jgi:mycoredoxin